MEKCCTWDNGSLWLKDRPCKIYVGQWPIFHGLLILPYIIVRLKLFLYIKKWHRLGVFVPLRALALVLLVLSCGSYDIRSTVLNITERLINTLNVHGCTCIHVNPPWSSGRLPEMSSKISSKTYHLLQKFRNHPHLNAEFYYICYTFLITLPEMEGKSPCWPFETYHMYVHGCTWMMVEIITITPILLQITRCAPIWKNFPTPTVL